MVQFSYYKIHLSMKTKSYCPLINFFHIKLYYFTFTWIEIDDCFFDKLKRFNIEENVGLLCPRKFMVNIFFLYY